MRGAGGWRCGTAIASWFLSRGSFISLVSIRGSDASRNSEIFWEACEATREENQSPESGLHATRRWRPCDAGAEAGEEGRGRGVPSPGPALRRYSARWVLSTTITSSSIEMEHLSSSLMVPGCLKPPGSSMIHCNAEPRASHEVRIIVRTLQRPPTSLRFIILPERRGTILSSVGGAQLQH